VAVWAQRVGDADPAGAARPLRVGLSWAGRPTHLHDRHRSIPLAALTALAEVPDVTFFSLQKWDPAGEVNAAPGGLRLVDVTPRLFNFADTAALIANLDLVLCVDTAVAHLAGAMGRPAWVMLPFSPDFRWLLDRSDSPWYPTLRLFRQPAPGDWTAVFSAVGAELRARSASRNRA
jgi:ADP-heptose:LPS heptosyltransferase